MPSPPRPERRGRGRRALPRPDPDRHVQLRRRQRAGGAGGGRVRRRPSSPRSAWSPRCSSRADRRTSVVVRSEGEDSSRPGLLVHGHLDVVPAEAADWTARPVRRRDRRRLPLGPRRGRHEGHGRDDARARPRVAPRRAASRRATSSSLPRRRGGRRQARARTGSSTTTPTCSTGVSEAISEVGGFSFTARRPAGLPDRDRAEGHRLAAAGRRGPRRARLDGQRRQRGHRAGRGGRPDRSSRVADADDPDGARVPRGDRRGARHRVRP